MRGLAPGRCLALAGVALVAGVSLDVIATSSPGDSNIPNRTSLPADVGQKLAVVVPAYQGDLDRAVASLERWPTNCSPLTVENVDLVLYYAEGETDRSAVEEAAGTIAATAGRCFGDLRIVYANLEDEVRSVLIVLCSMRVASSIKRTVRLYSLACPAWRCLKLPLPPCICESSTKIAHAKTF